MVKSAIGYSYPYKAGTVKFCTRYYTKEEIKKVLDYFLKNDFQIEINYEKSEIKMCGSII